MTPQKKSRDRSKDQILLGLFLAWLVLLALFASTLFQNFRPLIFPPPFRSQISPQNWINLKAPSLPKEVAKPEVITHGPRSKPLIALTFDADLTPAMLVLYQRGVVGPWYNAAIKDTLDRTKTPATIFLGGLWTRTYPHEAKALAQDPLIEIGNHSNSDYAFAPNCFHLPLLEDDKDRNDVLAAQQIIKTTTSVTPRYFRFPGGP